LLSPEQYAGKAKDFLQRNIARVYTKYQALLKQNNALDFDDLLLRTAQAFRDHPEVLRQLQERFQYILIDEYQDTNHAQYIIAHAMAQGHRNICVVGDPDQCLPPGVAVQTPHGPKPVEAIVEGESVVSGTGWAKSAPMAVDKVMAKTYAGPLVRVRTEDGCELRATPNHIGFARLRADASLHYTYLMYRRGVGYRIGTTRGVRTSKSREICSGLQVRANQEVADAMWVLHSSRSSAEARFYEHFYSVRYGIPTMVFFVRGRRMDITQDWVDRLYRDIDTEAGAERLMSDLHIDRRYPHHRPGGVTRSGAGVMHVPRVVEQAMRLNSSTVTFARRHVFFTMFGDGRPVTRDYRHMHRVQLVTSDLGMRAAASVLFKVRDGVRGTWRIETSRKDYDAGLALARDIATLADDMEVVSRARLTDSKAFQFMPLSHFHPGMVVPVCKDGQIVESVVEAVAWEDYEGPVYDLSVPHTRNYVAGGIVVHNSIYAWRGANIKNILEFERDYPDAKIVKLEQNYRSTKAILAIASGLIAKNVQRKEKGLWTENKDGEPARLFLCSDEHDESAVITRQLQDLHAKHGIPWSDMAIFYRMNSLSRVIEDSLFKSKIPYQIARGVEFYNRKEIKDVLAYMRLIANPADEVSLDRIVNVPARGLSDTTMKQIAAYAVGHGISTLNAMVDAASVTGLTTRAVNGAKAFVDLMRRWRKMAGLAPAARPEHREDAQPSTGSSASPTSQGEMNFVPPAAEPGGRVRALMEDVVRFSGLEGAFKKGDAEKEQGERAIDNVNELITSAAEFDRDQPEGTLADYLAGVTLVGDTDRMNEAGGAVTLMTLHAAKGLEFPAVVIAGLEDGILPHSRARDDFNQLEEERRLCFVGITRAQEHLILTKAQFRTVRGLRERTITSQFLNELPQDFVRVTDRTGTESFGPRPSRPAPRGTPRAGAGAKSAWVIPGQLVRHPTFGLGRVVEMSQSGQGTRAVIDFNTAGRKTLVLEYANLQVVEKK
jgi:DNA helicase-2/ATP-dependent DNA helicase PcrA